jgi:hypothetical protein
LTIAVAILFILGSWVCEASSVYTKLSWWRVLSWQAEINNLGITQMASY